MRMVGRAACVARHMWVSGDLILCAEVGPPPAPAYLLGATHGEASDGWAEPTSGEIDCEAPAL